MSYESAREAFDACIRDNDPLDPWSKLQARLYVWQVNEYGNPNPAHPALGVMEEIGELVDAKNGEETWDAIADISIFAVQLATCFRLDFGDIVRTEVAIDHDRGIHGLVSEAGRLCHVVLKSEQKIRGLGDRDVARRAVHGALVPLIRRVGKADLIGGSYFDKVSKVAEKVMARKKDELAMVVR